MTPDLAQLGQQLPYLLRPGEIRRKPQNGYEAQCLAFLDRAVIETCLNSVMALDGWEVRFATFGSDGAVNCSLGLFTGGQWMWRDGIGYPEDSERPAMSASTNAFKRAAAAWGIGRFLRDFPKPWLPCKVNLLKLGDATARVPVFKAWDCDPEDEMERAIAISRSGGAARLFAIIEEHKVPATALAKWCLAQNCRDVRQLSASQRGQLESLIVSSYFTVSGGANGDVAQG